MNDFRFHGDYNHWNLLTLIHECNTNQMRCFRELLSYFYLTQSFYNQQIFFFFYMIIFRDFSFHYHPLFLSSYCLLFVWEQVLNFNSSKIFLNFQFQHLCLRIISSFSIQSIAFVELIHLLLFNCFCYCSKLVVNCYQIRFFQLLLNISI